MPLTFLCLSSQVKSITTRPDISILASSLLSEAYGVSEHFPVGVLMNTASAADVSAQLDPISWSITKQGFGVLLKSTAALAQTGREEAKDASRPLLSDLAEQLISLSAQVSLSAIKACQEDAHASHTRQFAVEVLECRPLDDAESSELSVVRAPAAQLQQRRSRKRKSPDTPDDNSSDRSEPRQSLRLRERRRLRPATT